VKLGLRKLLYLTDDWRYLFLDGVSLRAQRERPQAG
jgi:hypothetical protein